MIVFPVLCIAMFRHFLDSPLKHLWIIFFGVYGATQIRFVHVVWVQLYLLSEYTCTFWSCVFLYGLGFAGGLVLTMYCDFQLWMGDGYIRMYLAMWSRPVMCHPLAVMARSSSWFLRVLSITVPYGQPVAVAVWSLPVMCHALAFVRWVAILYS